MNPRASDLSSRADLRAPTTQLRRGSTVGGLRVLTLILSDAVLLALAWKIAETLGTRTESPWNVAYNPSSLLPILSIFIGVFTARGLYQAGGWRRDYLGIVQSITLAEGLLVMIAYFYEPEQFVSRSHFLLFWVFSSLLVCTGRFCVDFITIALRERGVVRYPVCLIADPDQQQQSIELIRQEKRYDILDTTDAHALDRNKREETFARLRQVGIVEVFVAWDAIKNRLFLCWHFQTAGITLHILPVGIEPMLQKIQNWAGAPSLTFRSPVLIGIDFGVKRVFDFCCTLLLLVVLSPVFLAIAIAIRLDSAGPIFYRQTRIGLHSQQFKVWKFRTMVANADKLQKALEAQNEMKDGIMFKMKDDPRITRVGKFLRRYSLDELPQLFNVLFGEMSLVGPRPFPVRDVEKFSEHHFIRHEVLPGITGLWQVSGRSNITDFEQVIYWDLSYIEKWSIWLDLEILLRTVKVVLNRTGAY
jgi:exopolysaccharide biosynthesis polyprenyl glycosylphosphotransferase